MAAICVFCSGKTDLDASLLVLAEETGRMIGARGHSLVYGGGGGGMMGALALGARVTGAPTLGVTTRSLAAAEKADAAHDDLVVADTLADRKSMMIDKADAFLVLPGGLGTLDELFEVWTTGPQLRLHAKPIVVLNADDFYSGLITWLGDARDRGVIHPFLLDALVVATSVPESLDRIEKIVTVVDTA